MTRTQGALLKNKYFECDTMKLEDEWLSYKNNISLITHLQQYNHVHIGIVLLKFQSSKIAYINN